MQPPSRRVLAVTTLLLLAAVVGAVTSPPERAAFAATIAQLSEPEGYFDSDNLISNERSYLQVIPAIRDSRPDGGAYIGVGPDQNFTYIAHTRPSVAYIIDIRRDNQLLHLMFKALFQLASNRAEYLGLLFGRPAPPASVQWEREDLEHLIAYVDGAAPIADPSALRARVDGVVRGFGVPLSERDFATIDRFHRSFISRGLDLKFESTGRGARAYYPTYRDLLLEADQSGRRWNYLASEADFKFLRSLEERDLVLPVVGNVAGRLAMAAIGRRMKEQGDRLAAIYVSNVEFYLDRDGAFDRFVANLSQLPHTPRSLVIRSVFPNFYGRVQFMPGYGSASVVQRVDDLLEGTASGRIRGYRDLVEGR
jgi:hypothetical protein